jgi:hypothetical protein
MPGVLAARRCRRFEERQLRAAVRRKPDIAIAILREEGHIP